MPKSSPNLTLINLALLFYVLVSASKLLMRYAIVPHILIAAVYFGILSLIYNRREYLVLVCTSFLFLTFFFSFLEFRQFGWPSFWKTWLLHKPALYLYAFLLLPSLFLTYTLNFFQISTDMGSWSRRGLFRFFIPVIVKKELIVHRYKNIMAALWERGYDTTKAIKRLQLLYLWMIPLIITTLIEGVESYEYNQMLNAEITRYVPRKNLYRASMLQKVGFWFLVAALFGLTILRYV